MAQQSNNFEGGTNGVTLTQGSGGNTGGASGDYFDQVAKPSDGIMQFINSPVAEGSLAVQMATRTVTGALNLIWTATRRGQIADDYIKFWYWTDDKTTGSVAKNIIRWYGSGSSLGGILMGNNRLYATDTTNATNSTYSTTLMAAGQWVRIEAHMHPRTDGTGSLEVQLFLSPFGTTPDWDYTVTGLTHAQAYTDQLVIGNAGPGANWPSATGFMYFDGIVAGASTWVGPGISTFTKQGGAIIPALAGGTKLYYIVQFQRPNADLAVAGWTPTPGSPTTLYDKVSEVNPDDTNYISSTAT